MLLLLMLLLLLQVSWDFHNAAKHGFTLLQQQVEQLKIKPDYGYRLESGLKGLPAAKGWSWQQWADLLSDPLSCKLPDLQEAAKQLHVFKSGTKAELIVRLLGAFGLKAPSKAPPQVLRALALERMCWQPWVGTESLLASQDAIYELLRLGKNCPWQELVPDIQQQIAAATGGITRQQLAAADSAAAWRQLLVSTGVETKAQLRQLKERVERAQGEVVSAIAREREARDRAALEGQVGDVAAGGVQGDAAQPAAAAATQQGGAGAAEVQGQLAEQAAAGTAAAAAQQGGATAAEVQGQVVLAAAAAAEAQQGAATTTEI
jgi:hypothetical protein